MKILHIVPAAFNYFDDIRELVFGVVDKLDTFADVEQKLFTLEYGPPTTRTKATLSHIAPTRTHQAVRSISALVDTFGDYDIVHVHTPFLGGGKLLSMHLEQHPRVVVTYYRDVALADLLSYFIRWYNRRYVPRFVQHSRIFINCAPTLFLPLRRIIDREGIKIVDLAKNQFFSNPLTNSSSEVQLKEKMSFVAQKFLLTYQSII